MSYGDLGDTWQLDPADPSVGIMRDAIYHQAGDGCDVVDEDWQAGYVRVECACGAIYSSGESA
jgi:hypothetical protein